ncbi:MAG: helix-turn-helix transcriptional regulator [Eubacteriales bacterium]
MEIAIGSKIKQLRRTYDRTQEAMAQALGVTSQAISRWENGTGYPDIEIIPAIANYFGVTIDALFGYDGERNEKIRSILKRADELEKAEPAECLDYMRVAAAEFPASDEITVRLANTLNRCGWAYYGAVSISGEEEKEDGTREEFCHPDYEHNRGNKYWQEALILYEKLIGNTENADIREEAVENAAHIYWEFGDHAAIRKLAAAAPHLRTSREMLLSLDETQNNHGAALMVVLGAFKDLVLNTVKMSGGPDDAIRECETLLSLYHFIFDDGRFGKYHRDLFDLYARLCWHFWKTGDRDKAFEALENAKKHFDTFETLRNAGVYGYSSVYTKGTLSDPSEWVPKYGKSENDSERFGDCCWFSEEFCPGIRADARFYEIANKKYVNP